MIGYMTGPFYFLTTLVVGLFAFWWMIRALNKSTGVKWSETKKAIFEDGNIAVAIRAGCMYLAVAFVIAVAIDAGSNLHLG